jgi:hypothetical protein
MEVEAKEEKHLPRLSRHILSQLVCLGRHTMTNLLTTEGRQYIDWTADYRMYSRERIDCAEVFDQVRKEVQALNSGNPVVITALDDSLLRKSGKKIPGIKFARDPMGPPFHVNFVRGQRVIQMSAAVSEDGQSRMVPVMFKDASTPAKPGRNASIETWARYKEECKACRLSVRGTECIREMRSQMEPGRNLWVAVDGSYTNRTVLNHLPDKTVIIGRIRSDAKLYYPPVACCRAGAGRKRLYGLPAPTPEEIRTNESIAWQPVQAYASGKLCEFKVKVMKNLRWRGSGTHDLQLLIIAPLRYRLSQGARLLYRNPAYLICTDPEIPAEKLLQAYLWRWGIETNFRDEKTLLGTGEAQVRNPASVRSLPQMMVASYSLLLLAGIKLWGVKGMPQPGNLPKWQDPNKKLRASTNDLIKQLRSDLWADSIASMNLSDFASKQKLSRSRLNINFPAFSAVLNVNTN